MQPTGTGTDTAIDGDFLCSTVNCESGYRGDEVYSLGEGVSERSICRRQLRTEILTPFPGVARVDG